MSVARPAPVWQQGQRYAGGAAVDDRLTIAGCREDGLQPGQGDLRVEGAENAVAGGGGEVTVQGSGQRRLVEL